MHSQSRNLISVIFVVNSVLPYFLIQGTRITLEQLTNVLSMKKM